MDRNRASRGSRRRDWGDQDRSDFEEPKYFQRRHETPPEGVDAEVLWFNAAKGYGFVQVADGTKAFLHASKLEAAGCGTVSEGGSIKVIVQPGDKGLQVSRVLEVGAAPAPALEHGSQERALDVDHAHDEVDGTVKFYNSDKGFGFIGPTAGGKDIFVHVSVLARSGIAALAEGQHVRVRYAEGHKGLEARSVRLT